MKARTSIATVGVAAVVATGTVKGAPISKRKTDVTVTYKL